MDGKGVKNGYVGECQSAAVRSKSSTSRDGEEGEGEFESMMTESGRQRPVPEPDQPDRSGRTLSRRIEAKATLASRDRLASWLHPCVSRLFARSCRSGQEYEVRKTPKTKHYGLEGQLNGYLQSV